MPSAPDQNMQTTHSSQFMQYNFDQPETIRTWGKQCAPILDKRIAAAKEKMHAHQIADTLVNDRLAAFSDILKRVTPHWLDEVKHFADGAGVQANDIIKLNCLPRALEYCGGGCTSFIQIGKHTNRLLKIRDEANNTQYYMTKQVHNQWYHAAADIGNLGYAHALSARGISGGNNTGSPATGVTDVPGMTDCHALRYMIENASSVDDIPALLEKLLAAKALSGAGPHRGSILMFCDQKRGLTLEYTLDNYVATFIDKDMYVVANHFQTPQASAWRTEEPEANSTTRHARMTQLLTDVNNTPTVEDVASMVRDVKHAPDALCNDDADHEWMSVSVQLHEINRENVKQSRNYLCCGNPRFSPFLAVPVTQKNSFIPLASGAYYNASDHLYARRKTRPTSLADLQNIETSSLHASSYDQACVAAHASLNNAMMED